MEKNKDLEVEIGILEGMKSFLNSLEMFSMVLSVLATLSFIASIMYSSILLFVLFIFMLVSLFITMSQGYRILQIMVSKTVELERSGKK